MSLRWSSATDQLYAVSNSSPSLDLDFASNKSLLDNISGNNLITFSRASTGTYVGSDGLIKTTPVNFILNSDFPVSSNANATQSDANNITTPAGITTTVKRLTGSDFTRYGDLGSGTPNTTYTGSIYVRTVSGTDTITIDVVDGPSKSYDITEAWRRIDASGSVSANYRFFDLNLSNSDIYIWGAQLEEGTTATAYIPTTNLPSGAPRFDHEPVTGESLGLLIEEERTNLLTYSEQFDQSAWAVGGTVSVVPNSALSPDGLMTADQITLGAVNSRIGQFNLITTTGQTGTASVYLKNIDHVGVLTLRTGLAGGAAYNLNLSLTNEWVRYELTTTHNGTQNVEFHIRETDATPSGSFLMWGAQLEVGSFPTSYIPTSGSTVTRSPDLATIEGTNFSSWYNQSEGTVFIKGSTSDIDANTGWSSFFQASSPNNNRISIRQGQTIITSAGTGVTLTNSASPTVNETEEIAFAYKENDFAQYTSYANPAFQGTGLTPVSVDTLLIASVEGSGSVFNLNGHITRLAYYPYRLSDTILQEITS